MANKDVIIRISATDAASPTFRRIASEAKSMGAQVTQSSESAGRSFEGFNKRAAAIGAAIGTATLALGEFSRAAAEDEASTARLQQAVESTGAAYDDYADKLDAAIKKGQDKAYADDKVRDALVKLTVATGSTQAALDQMGLAMDLARARGIDLASAADIVGKVYNGNTGILSRYGLAVEDGATATQALAQLQTRVAGQADAYANTQAGAADRIRIAFDEATEAIGRHVGGLQQVLMLMPGLTAGYSTLAGVVGGLTGASGGLGLLAGGIQLAGAGALGGIAYGYAKDDVGTTFANDLANKIFLVMASLLNATVPGNPLDTQKYVDQMNKNATWDQILAAFGSPEAAAKALGIQGTTIAVGGYTSGNAVDSNGNPIYVPIPGQDVTTATQPPTADEVYAAIVNAAAAGNMTVAEYLATPAVRAASISSYYLRTGKAGQGDVYGTGGLPLASSAAASPYGNAPLNPATGRPAYGKIGGLAESSPGSAPVDYSRGGGGAVANDLYLKPTLTFDAKTQGQIEANNLEAYREELRKTYGAYAGLVEGINSANDATSAFKATQDGLLQAEQPYSQQISEYTGQVNAMQAAYDILNQRQQEGGQLTQEQTDFMNNYNEALERGQGGIEDATVAQGMLAQQYLLNMEQGDKLNQTLAGTTETVDGLTRTIQDLILAMDGVPDEVKTDILLSRADESIADLITYYNWLNSIPGSVTTVVETVYQSSGDPGSGGRFRGAADGATIYPGIRHYSDGGTHAIVGERGPELVWLPNGAQVTHTEATKSRLRGRTRDVGLAIYGPVTLYPAGQDAYGAISGAALAGAR